ncbi:hypothetical protein K469DRAFT_750109 [Zopfia rhizophila CBS 207.26]|uniref:Uncharacterized protein n=1 Tax=Zopfia rhizophila CBS 207.26 TaxID=1314779 RepID=A0A6A6E5C4_9PEZI|nr:hypothetical protein K469DRAFT_750109 [Zopfia rhizophila CBS 207.26]
MPSDLAPLHKLNSEDRGSIIIISAYFWVYITIVIAIIRFSLHKSKVKIQSRRFNLFNCRSTRHSEFSLLSCIPINGGLGRHVRNLSPDGLALYYKVYRTNHGIFVQIARLTDSRWRSQVHTLEYKAPMSLAQRGVVHASDPDTA